VLNSYRVNATACTSRGSVYAGMHQSGYLGKQSQGGSDLLTTVSEPPSHTQP
jgi:hypothetical protein